MAVLDAPDRCPTVKINHPSQKGDYIIINESDFDKKIHTKYEGEEDDEDEPAPAGATNASGTFDEPTPTDIRYPNKNTTEFENNHGAYLGQSASELRKGADMEDKPGGLHPEVHEGVQDAAVAEAAARESAARMGGGLKRKVVVKKLDDTESEKVSKGKKKSKSDADENLTQ